MPLDSATDLALLGFMLISISLVFVIVAFVAIRKKKFRAHKNFMNLGIISNSIFLITYIYRFFTEGNTEFPGPNWFLSSIYLPVLIIHISTAIISIYFVFRQFYNGWKGQTFNSEGEMLLQGNYRINHIKHGYKAIIIWGSSFIGGILVFVMLYLIFD